MFTSDGIQKISNTLIREVGLGGETGAGAARWGLGEGERGAVAERAMD